MVFKYFFPQNRGISKEIFWLAYPVIISNLSRVLMSVFDVAMVGRLGAAALAATGMGGMLFWGALSLTLGIRTAVQTVASRRLGQKLDKKSGTAFHNGIYMATAYAVPVSFFGWAFVEKIVPFFVNDAQATPLAIEYTSIVFLSLLFSAYSFVFQGFYTGIEKTKIHMRVTIISNLVNIYLNAGLIYGSSGVRSFINEKIPDFSFLSFFWDWASFPALGVKGAAISTLIASLWMVVHYAAYLFSKDIKTRFFVFSFSYDKTMMSRQIGLALPLGIQEGLIAIGWGMFYKIVGMIGLIELATTQLLFTIMHASFMPALGVGQACSTLVSKYMGEKRIDLAAVSIKESVRLALYIMATMGLSFVLFPEQYLMIFTNDSVVINAGVFGLQMIGAVQFLDAIGFVLWFALSGAGDTMFPAIVESVLTWVVIVLGSYLLGVVFQMGFKVLWLLFPLHMGLFAGIMVWKVNQGSWKDIEV